MAMTAWKIAAIGECMLELSNPAGQGFARNMQMNFSYGGDTLNTAVYLGRLGTDCSYVTCLGDDPCSAWMIQEWVGEGVDTSLVFRLEGKVPGLYMIQTDLRGERSFLYWRKEAPARELLADTNRSKLLFDKLAAYDLVYLSGITLSLYDESSLERLFDFLAGYRKSGGRVAFDGNYRPRGWRSADYARVVFNRMYALSTLVMPTFDDEQTLYSDTNPDATIDRLSRCGVEEIAIKQGAKGVTISSANGVLNVGTTPVEKVVDSTAAGDSFNAGYLAARAKGKSPSEAARWGNRLAGTVIGFRGAIIPVDSMPDLELAS